MTLSPISRNKLAADVAEQLVGQIRGNGLEPGTRMPSERELMVALGVGLLTSGESWRRMARRLLTTMGCWLF